MIRVSAAAVAVTVAVACASACGSFGEADVGPSVDAGGGDAGDAGDASTDVDGAALGRYAMEVGADAPLAWYPLDDPRGSPTVRNAIDPAKPGKVKGAVILESTSLVAGGGAAASFDGASSTLDLGTGLELAGVVPYSLEVWIYPGKLDTSYRRLFSNEADVNGPGWAGYSMSVHQTELVFTRVSSGTVCNTTVSPAPFAVMTTHHVVATFDGTTSRLFVDGAQVAAKTCATANVHLAGTLAVGAQAAGGSSFSGVMDEIAIYGKALSPDRIKAHYDAGKR